VSKEDAMSDSTTGLSAAEKKAIKERAAETRKRQNGDAEARKVMEAMTPEERDMALRLHDAILERFPRLQPKLRYGQPAYYLDGKVICFFMAASKYGTRYSTFGFEDAADFGEEMWPSSFGITALSEANLEKLLKLVATAVG
jgi:uncharacterized protein YdhG (YjbR/CyaY superfamily)